MNSNWNHAKHRALESLDTFRSVLADDSSDDRRLINGYLEAKRSFAKAFETFGAEKFDNPSILESALDHVQCAMKRTYPDLPPKYLRVRGFGRVHSVLLSYLLKRVGSEVLADELRMLTADAVHTERRARDLRDLGYSLTSMERSGRQVYVLNDSVPNVAKGSAVLITRNIRDDKSLSSSEKEELLRRVEVFD